MNTQTKTYTIWNLDGKFYDELMNSMPCWVFCQDQKSFDQVFDDWFFMMVGV